MAAAALTGVAMATESKGSVGYVPNSGVIQSNGSTHVTDPMLLPS